jgi:RNA polymerase sigma-70 factor (ECF subfamily)
LVNRPSDSSDGRGARSLPPAETLTPEAAQAEVRRAQQGDRVALDAIVRRYHEDVARVLWRFVRQRADLDDLVQETFLRALRNLKQWRSDRPFIHWLRRIAANTGRDYYRRQTVRRRWQVETPAESGDEAPRPEAADPHPDPAARAAADEVKTLLAQLSPDDAAILTLHYLEGWGLHDIAAAYGWTHTATKLRAWRARSRLRALYEPRTESDS